MSHFFKRFFTYIQERYPPATYITLALLLALVSSIGTQMFFSPKFQAAGLFLSFGAIFFFLFRLRLFDDLKDFEHDAAYYPNRPLQRGVVSKKEISLYVLICALIEISIAVFCGLAAIVFFLAAFIYSCLMFKEFFAKDWLRKNFAAYVVSHEILVIPLFFYLFSLNRMALGGFLEPYFWWLMLFLGAQIFLLEVVRKIRPKEAENASADTYTAQYGVAGASGLAVVVATVLFFLKIGAEKSLGLGIGLFALSPLLFHLIFVLTAILFLRKPVPSAASRVFAAAILYVVLTDFQYALHVLVRS